MRKYGPKGVLGWLIRVGVVYPWGWLASVYVVWLIAWAALGRRPRPLLDDPKTLSDWVNVPHTISVWLLMLAVPMLGTALAATLTLAFSRAMKWGVALAWLAVLQLSWLLAVLTARFDPGHVIAWFVD